jgi:hypothetical protein
MPPQSGLQSANVPEKITLEKWAGINRNAARTGIDDQECWWLENLLPLGPTQLRSAWGPSAAIYTAPGGVSIARMFFMNIDGAHPLGFMFLTDGTVTAVNLNTGATNGLGAVWTPQAPIFPADMKLWAPSVPGGQIGGALIGSPKGLYAVDANFTVTAPGAAAPTWLTNGQTGFTMPSGLPGIFAMEVYKERLWVMGTDVISFSAPSNGSDFSTSGGGGSFPYHGDMLTVSWTDMKASAGFLYLFADSSTNQITDLSLFPNQTPIGTINTTQFQNANVDPQTGHAFFRQVGVWLNALAMFNSGGIYLMANGQAVWASEKITPILQTIDTVTFQPTQTAAHLFGQKFLLFNARLADTDGVVRSLILVWSGPQANQWVVCSQRYNLTHIGGYEQNSSITPYGTDGAALYRLFAQPDPALIKRIQSKAYIGAQGELTIKDWKRVYIEMADNRGGPEGVFLTGSMATRGGGIPNGMEDVSYSLDPKGADTVPSPTFGKGIAAMLDLRSLSPDFTINRISFTFDERTLYGA